MCRISTPRGTACGFSRRVLSLGETKKWAQSFRLGMDAEGRSVRLGVDYVLHHSGYNYRVGPNGLLIGRSHDCDITVENIAVSRHHCHVCVTGGSLLVRDLGSSQGTYVNGRRVGARGRALKVGDRLLAADVALIALEYAPRRASQKGGLDLAAALPRRAHPERRPSLGPVPNLAPILRPEDESISLQLLARDSQGVASLMPARESRRVASMLEDRHSDIPNLAPQLRPSDESVSVMRFGEATNGNATIEAILHSSIPPRDLGDRISQMPLLSALVRPSEVSPVRSAHPPPEVGDSRLDGGVLEGGVLESGVLESGVLEVTPLGVELRVPKKDE